MNVRVISYFILKSTLILRLKILRILQMTIENAITAPIILPLVIKIRIYLCTYRDSEKIIFQP